MKILKLLLWLVALLVVALAVTGYYADGLAKTAIEKAGTEALGVETTVGSVDIGFFRGRIELEDKRINNPEGYGGGHFFELGKGAIEVSALSLLSDKVEVPLLELSGIRVNLIQGAQGSNYGTILDNLKRFQGTPDTTQEDGDAKRFVIKKLLIEDVIVRVVPSKELNLGAVAIPIDRLELKDVGSKSDKGVLLAELAGIVVESILKRASATGLLPGLIKGGLDGQLGQLRGMAAAGLLSLDSFTDGAPLPAGVQKGVDDVKKSIDKRLKGLLGR